MREFVENGFVNQFGNEKRFYDDDVRWKSLKSVITGTYRIKCSRINDINKKLEEQNIAFRIYQGRETSGEHRGKSYFEMVSPEELEKRKNKPKRKSMKKK